MVVIVVVVVIAVVVVIGVVVVVAHATSRGPVSNACFQAFQWSYHILSGFSGCSVFPKLSCCLLPKRGWGGGVGGRGHDDALCRLHHWQPFRVSGEMPANQSTRCLLCVQHALHPSGHQFGAPRGEMARSKARRLQL